MKSILQIFLIIIGLSFVSIINAQEFSKIYSSNANTLFRKTIYSENKNCYFTLGEYGTGNQRVGLIIKLDLNGNIIWSKKFNVASLVERIGEVIDPVTKKSHIIISGSTFSGGNNLQVIKVDADNGSVVWSNLYSSLTYPHSIIMNNEIFLIGTNGNGVIVAKLNPNGTLSWSNYYNSNNHELFFAGYPDLHSNGNMAFTFRANQQFGVMAINPNGEIVFSKISDRYRRFRNLSSTKDGYIFSYVYSWENRNNNHGFIKIDTLGNLILNKHIYSTSPNLSSSFSEFSVTQTESNKIIYNATSGISGRHANNYFIFDINGNLIKAYDSKIDSIYVEQLQNVSRGLVTLSGSSIQKSGCISANTNGVLSLFKEDGSLCGLNQINNIIAENDPMKLVNTNVNYINRNLSISPLNYITSDISLTPSFMCEDSSKLFNLGDDINICNTQSFSIHAGVGYSKYLWSTGATTPSITVNTTNNYWAEVTDACNRVFRDTIRITFGSNKSFNQSISLCPGQSYYINNHTYNKAGTYRDTLKTLQGCDSIVVTTITLRTAGTTNNPQTICQGQSIKIGNKSYTTTGIYRDTLKTAFECDSIIITNLTVNPTFSETNTLSICQGDSVKVGNKYYFLEGNYIDTLKTILGCDSIINSQIKVLNSTTEEVSFIICPGESVEYNGKTYDTPGSYQDIIKNSKGCDSIITNIYVENMVEPLMELGNDTTICSNEHFEIGTEYSDATYLWNTGSEEAFIEVKESGIYTLTISNKCYSVSDTIQVEILDCDCKVFIPNAFSPNGDGKNDVLVVKEENIVSSKFIIYNKWGEEIFETRDNQNVWNGIHKEKHLAPDVYGYYYVGECLQGNKIELKGNITIVK